MNPETEKTRIQTAIREKYAHVSTSAIDRFAYPTGSEGARNLGYDMSLLEGVTEAMMNSFCGVGNPFSAGPVNEGEQVLDIGCGSGIDLIIAARMSGETGQVRGIDLTPEMVKLAQQNTAQAGLSRLEILEAATEAIPYPDQSFTLVLSNGVLNLTADKELAFTEIYRVLAPGGRVQFADIVYTGETHQDNPLTYEAWSE